MKSLEHEGLTFDYPTPKPRSIEELQRRLKSPFWEEEDKGFVKVDPAQAPTENAGGKKGEEDETKQATKAPITTSAPTPTLTLVPTPEHIPEPPRRESAAAPARGRNPIDKVQQGLYIGDLRGARHRELLREHNITAIVSLVGADHFRSTQPWFRKAIPEANHLHIPCMDVPTEDLLLHFGRINNFILNRLVDPSAEKEPNVLVHCAMGISRSASAVIAFLMMRNSWDYDTSLKFLRKKRPAVRPNPGFEEQLRIWGGVGFDLWEDEASTVPKGEYARFLERKEKVSEEADRRRRRREWLEVMFKRAPRAPPAIRERAEALARERFAAALEKVMIP